MEIILIIGLYIFLFIMSSKLSEISRVVDANNAKLRKLELSNQTPPKLEKISEKVSESHIPTQTISSNRVTTEQPEIEQSFVFHDTSKKVEPVVAQKLPEKSVAKKTTTVNFSIGNWIAKVGLGIFLIGIIYLTFYAFSQEWISAEQITGTVIIIGMLISALGLIFQKSNPGQCMLLTFTGVGTSMIAIVAGRFVLGFIPPEFALVMLFSLDAYASAISIKLKYYSILHFCILLGSVLPFLTSAGGGVTTFIFYYLSAILAGAFTFTYYSKRFDYIITGIIVALCYFLAFGTFIETNTIQIFIYVYSVIFLALGIYASYIEKENESFFNSAFPILTTGFFFITALIDLSRFSNPILTTNFLIWAFFSALVSVALSVLRSKNRFANTLFLSSVLLFIYSIFYYNLFTSDAISQLTHTNPLLFELLIVLFISLFYNLLFTKSVKVTFISLALMIIPTTILGVSIVNANALDIFDFNHFMITLFMGIGFYAFYYVFIYFGKIRSADNDTVVRILLALASGIILYLFWYAYRFIGGSTLHWTLVLTTYTVIGIVSYIMSELSNNKYWNISSIILLVAVILRLLIVDIWTMDLGPRIATFIFIGAVLIISSFVPGMLKGLKGKIEM